MHELGTIIDEAEEIIGRHGPVCKCKDCESAKKIKLAAEVVVKEIVASVMPQPECPECGLETEFDCMEVLRCYNEECSTYGRTANVPQPIDEE